MIYANSEIHARTLKKLPSQSRKRCNCGCKGRSTHIGLGNKCGMMAGCEMAARRWVKNL